MGNFSIDLAYLVGDWVETVLWGVYSVLFGTCMWYIWKKRRTELFHFTTVTLVLMYIFATCHIALALRRLIEGFIIFRSELDPQLYFANVAIHIKVAKDYFYVALMVLGDSIIVWRCFIVWNRSYPVLILPVLMLIATAIGGFGAAANLPNTNIVVADNWGESMFITSLITNVFVTCLTAGRIWYQSRGSRKFFPVGSSGYTQVLLLVIESGLIISLVKATEFTLWYVSPDDGLNGNNGIYILYESIVQFEGIVPTTMILAVILGYTSRKTYVNDNSVGVSFRAGPPTSTLGTWKNSDAQNMHEMNRIQSTSDSFPNQKPSDSFPNQKPSDSFSNQKPSESLEDAV